MSNKLTKRALSCAVASSALITAIGAFTPAMAQIDEIIVTSQKREQSLQSIPLSVTAFDAAALEIKQIETFSDLQFNTPNVNYTATNFGGGGNFQIRGIGSAAVGASGDGGVGIHINDAPMRSAALLSTEYFDLERVEILRGPQGTLFGRNATGGVLNMITAKADPDGFAGNVDVSVGNYNHTKIKGMLNIPLGDNLAVRVAGIRLNRDGYTDNLYTGKDIDGRDQFAYRGSVRWTPGDNTTIDFMYSYFEEDSSRSRTYKQMCHRDDSGILGCLPDKLAFETTNSNSTLGSIVASAETMAVIGSAHIDASGVPFPTLIGGLLGWSSILNPSDSYNSAINPRDLRTVSTDFDPSWYSDETLWTLQFEHEFDQHTLTLLYSDKENAGESFTDYNWAVNGELGFDPYDVLTDATLNAAFPGLSTYAFLYADGIPTSLINSDDTGLISGDYVVGDRPDGYDRSYGSGSQWTMEARLASNRDGEFNYLVGAFMMHTESATGYNVVASSLDYFALIGGMMLPGVGLGAGVGPGPGGENVLTPGLGLLSPYYHNQSPTNELDSWAIFGEAYFEVNDDIRITGGIRFNHDEKSYVGFQSLLAEGAAPLGGTGAITPGSIVDGNTTWEELTGRLLFEWTPDLNMTDDTLIYASYSRGYKGGGFNPGSFSGNTQATFDPEFINAYEIGMKNTMRDGTVTANFTAFKYDYEGYQVSKIVDRTSLNENIDAKIWGVEAEFVFAPDENWLTNMNFSFLNTEIGDAESIDGRDPTNGEAGYLLIKDLANAANCVLDPGAMNIATVQAFVNAPGIAALPFGTTAIEGLLSEGALTTCAGLEGAIGYFDGLAVTPAGWMVGEATITGGNAVDLSGNNLPNAPEWSISFGTQRAFYFDSGMSFTPRVDYFVQGDMYSRVFNKSVDKIGSWDMLNFSATIAPEDGSWELKAFVQNAMDDDNVTGHYFTDPTSGNFTNVFILEPRLYGVSFSAKF